MIGAADLALCQLLTLQAQLAEVRRTQRRLAAVEGRNDLLAASAALTAAHAALSAIGRTALELRRLLAVVGDGDRAVSITELGVRVQQWAVMHQLRAAAQALHVDRHRTIMAPPLFVGRVRSIAGLLAEVGDTFDVANSQWLAHRAAVGSETQEQAQVRRMLYRSGLCATQLATVRLATDPDLAHFLRKGEEPSESEALRTACRALRVMLDITLDVDAEPSPMPGPVEVAMTVLVVRLVAPP
jgi:hypothetical protein